MPMHNTFGGYVFFFYTFPLQTIKRKKFLCFFVLFFSCPQVFNISTLGEYADLYLRTDVLLLADIFENFRTQCLNAYGLDPAHYYTAPGITWDAMLKFTEVKLELLTDVDQVLFIERGIRGGTSISQCCHRYAKANNPYMNSYNAEQETSYIQYYDVNQLYAFAMQQALPLSGFVWVTPDNLWKYPWEKKKPDAEEGCILEVDLIYPRNIHDKHRDLPFCPEHMKPPGSQQPKLLTTLLDKSRYVIHYRNLQQALNHGLLITKIHRILTFKQSFWLKNYIDHNASMCQASTNAFEKNFFKLMCNACFGKTMESVRKRKNIKLCSSWEGRGGSEALISKPNFHSRAIFDDDLQLQFS